MTRGTKIDTEMKTKTRPKNLKQKRDSPPRRSLREILQQEAGIYGASLRGPAATNEPAVGISAKDRDEPAVQNLSEVKTKTTLLVVSSTGIPLQGASTSSTPTAGEALGHSLRSRWTPSDQEVIVRMR
jgi:hypothetical protein